MVKNLIRDQSQNQRQRLDTLRSQDHSSQVRRSEGGLHEDQKTSNEPKPKLAKLATLAHPINNWVCDTSHPQHENLAST